MEDLDALVRRVDEDRWLASRFAPAKVRARLIAIYALNYEIGRATDGITQEGLAAIRLQWWREAIDEIHTGKRPRAHPALQAYAKAGGAGLHQDTWDRIIDARGADVGAAPFADWAALEAFVEATAGGVLRLALGACGAPADMELARPAAQAWGYAGLSRAAPFWRARGRSPFPPGGDAAAMMARGRVAYAAAKAMRVESFAFPALGYVTIAPLYLRDAERGAPVLRRQLKLIGASLRGRV